MPGDAQELIHGRYEVMRHRLSVAIGSAASLLLIAPPATMGTPASTARSCPSYTITTHRTYSGQHWTYRVRIQPTSVAGIGCSGVHGLIRHADRVFSAHGGELGVYLAIGRWQCRTGRPFDGGPHGEPIWYSDCKRSGGKLSWTETQVSATRGR